MKRILTKEDRHDPVLVEEILSFFKMRLAQKKQSIFFLDGTLGAGGHTEAILSLDPRVVVFGIDRDQRAVANAKKRLERFDRRAVLLQGNFADAKDLLAKHLPSSTPQFDGIIVDLGISSLQLSDAERGFSFLSEAPLDMRMDLDSPLTAEQVVNTYPFPALVGVLKRGGVRKYQTLLARKIEEKRPLRSTRTLANICEDVFKKEAGTKKAHPATVPFQAIRIEVNDELGSLKRFLSEIISLLLPGGFLAVISFHSLEDELVARQMRAWSRVKEVRGLPIREKGLAEGELLTKKAITPSATEMERNPRSRSARLRVFQKTGELQKKQ